MQSLQNYIKAVNKTGEIIGQAGSEFGDGIYKGVKKTFENHVNIGTKGNITIE